MKKQKKINKKPKQDSINIPRKAMFGIAPAIAISAIIISKHGAGQLVLFLLGIGTGIIIGKGFFEK